MLHFTTLGTCQIDPARFQRAGLPTLALARIALSSKHLRKETLIEALWSPEAPSRVHQRFRQLTFSVRKAYPELNLRVEGETVLLDQSALRVDWLESLEFARAADLSAALRLQKGPFLAGGRFPTTAYEMWVDGIRASQARRIRSWIVRLLMLGDTGIVELEPALTALVAAAPQDPVVDLLRARILQWNGRVSAAKATLQDCQRRLPPNCRAIAKSMHQELSRARNSRIAAEQRSAPPFIGRSHEIGVLQHAWRKACGGALVNCELSGAAGIGKTRLSHQFARWVALQGGKPLVLRGEMPFNENLGRLLADLGVQPPSQPVGTTAARYSADSVELVINALAATASRQPVLLSIDDYQLTDSAIRQLAHMIMVRLPKTSLLLLIIARSQRDMPLVAAASLALRLEPMTDDEARQLILASAVRPLDPLVADAILARSTNLPLALVAWARLVVQESSVERQEAMLASTAPSSLLHDLVQRRSPGARAILRCLSLVRQAYPIRALLAVTGMPRDELERELESLVAEGLVTWSPDGVQLAHALYRLDASAALENEPARLKHRMMALSLMGCGSRYCREIARQLDLASDYGEAMKYYVRASRIAVRSANRSDAEECIAEALRLCRAHDMPDAPVQLAAASMHYQWEEYGVAAHEFRRALKSSLSLTRRRALEARIRWVRSATLAGIMRPPGETLRALLKMARKSGDTELEMEVAYTLLLSLPYGGDRQGFRRLAEDFRDISARSSDERAATRALVQSSILYFAGALPRTGEHFGCEALSRALAIADDHTVVEACGCVGAIQMGRGKLHDAAATFDIGIAARARLGYTPRRQLWFTNYGVYLLERGRWAEAEGVFQEGLEQNQQAGTHVTLNAHVRLNFALLHYESGRYDESLEYAEEFLRVDLQKSTELTAGAALVGLIAMHRGDDRRAHSVAQLLSNITTFFGDESYHHMLQARILVADGRADAACELLTTAYARLRRRYYPAAARVQLELLRLTDPPASHRLLEFAADCDRRGLTPLAERARA